MNKYFLLSILISLFSCSQSIIDQEDWILKESSTINHLDRGDKKTQVIYSTIFDVLTQTKDTSIVVQSYKDSLLLEEIEYSIIYGDTIKWSHSLKYYNKNGQLTEEIDSLDGVLQRHLKYLHEEGKVVREEFLSVYPNYNDKFEVVSFDSMKTTIHNTYDSKGINIMRMVLSRNEMIHQLRGQIEFDTALVLFQYDNQGLKTQATSIELGDTTSISKYEYDKYGRQIKSSDFSPEFGISIFETKYDDNDNVTSEVIMMDGFIERTIINYDEQNRPISKKIYKPNPLANKT